MTRHLKRDLGMEPATPDISLFYLRRGEKLLKMSGIYVDECIHAGSSAFLR